MPKKKKNERILGETRRARWCHRKNEIPTRWHQLAYCVKLCIKWNISEYRTVGAGDCEARPARVGGLPGRGSRCSARPAWASGSWTVCPTVGWEWSCAEPRRPRSGSASAGARARWPARAASAGPSAKTSPCSRRSIGCGCGCCCGCGCGCWCCCCCCCCCCCGGGGGGGGAGTRDPFAVFCCRRCCRRCPTSPSPDGRIDVFVRRADCLKDENEKQFSRKLSNQPIPVLR